MASKGAARVRKKEIVKVVHGALLRTNIKAQMASAAPPLGPQLETGHFKQGVPLPTRITVKPDRTYDLEICTPTTTWMLKQAAGIGRGKSSKDEIVGKLTVKHLYEIAKVKSRDKALQHVELEHICRMLIKTCRTLGIEVQYHDLNPDELKEFLVARKEKVDAQLKELADKKAAKMLRTT
ncbi:hypothetical protein L5515_005604 [Caenorhabditis briggsae]|uniref:Large ribosomal subunit protein uL11m n=1 Tax=Caenorhabditis briggsae TaxID=6238 RepID=A0AAE9JF72_CAEBR|nr:hypothetical protein L5515_005604 [Caenorhabditis briggsae]